jgi:hypothetical protein
VIAWYVSSDDDAENSVEQLNINCRSLSHSVESNTTKIDSRAMQQKKFFAPLYDCCRRASANSANVWVRLHFTLYGLSRTKAGSVSQSKRQKHAAVIAVSMSRWLTLGWCIDFSPSFRYKSNGCPRVIGPLARSFYVVYRLKIFLSKWVEIESSF